MRLVWGRVKAALAPTSGPEKAPFEETLIMCLEERSDPEVAAEKTSLLAREITGTQLCWQAIAAETV